MSTIGIIGTIISATLVIGIIVALTIIGRKVAPPAPQILAEESPQKLLPEEVDEESVGPGDAAGGAVHPDADDEVRLTAASGDSANV